MRMQKRQFRIGELAEHLGVERFVVRFWEKEFGLKPTRSDGGQRFYEEKDLDTLKLIKQLLYDRGLTIAGAKKQLKEETKIIASKRTVMTDKFDDQQWQQFILKLDALKQQLIKLHDAL